VKNKKINKNIFIAIDKIHINSYNSKNIKEPNTGLRIKLKLVTTLF